MRDNHWIGAFHMHHLMRFSLLLLGSLLCLSASAAEDRFAKVKIKSQPVAGNVHMLTGSGGNIAASVGADGTLIVDDQFAPLAERIGKALKQLGGDAPKLVVNTHFHGDHTGSNSVFGVIGTIVAHENVRVRLVAEEAPRAALPVVTFDDRVRLHFNDEAIDIVHLPAGHTDGDSLVWFRAANVVHMGDHLFNGFFPYIDVESGGTVKGFMQNLQSALDLVNAETQVIPGHGALGGVDIIAASLALVRDSAVLIMRETEAGTTDADIVAMLNAEFPAAGKGFIPAQGWLKIVRASRAATAK